MSPAAPGEPLAWVSGALVPRAEARVSVDDFAVRYGVAAFETMRAAHGRLFRLDAHLARLCAGLGAMRVAVPAEPALREAVAAVLEANALREAQVRLTVTGGSGRAPVLGAAASPVVIATAEPTPDAPPPPARLHVASVRLDAARPLAGAKVAQFLPYLLARAEARDAGADDALLLNHAGAVAEAATSNVFAVVDGRVVTPPPADGPLPGVTRGAVLEVAAALGEPAAEHSLALDDLARADELFLTSSIVGVRAVVTLHGDGVAWTREVVPGPVTTRLAEAYEALVQRETAV